MADAALFLRLEPEVLREVSRDSQEVLTIRPQRVSLRHSHSHHFIDSFCSVVCDMQAVRKKPAGRNLQLKEELSFKTASTVCRAKNAGTPWPQFAAVVKMDVRKSTLLSFKVPLAKAPKLNLEVSKPAGTSRG